MGGPPIAAPTKPRHATVHTARLYHTKTTVEVKFFGAIIFFTKKYFILQRRASSLQNPVESGFDRIHVVCFSGTSQLGLHSYLLLALLQEQLRVVLLYWYTTHECRKILTKILDPSQNTTCSDSTILRNKSRKKIITRKKIKILNIFIII